MLLNSDQMRAKGLIVGDDPASYRETSYDLQIGKILPAPVYDGSSVKDTDVPSTGFYLPPQGMVKVISRETIKLPRGVVGYALVKNGLSNVGLLAINIGIVDPGYEGPISSTLINFGKNPFLLSPKMTFLRLTFHEYQLQTAAPALPTPISAEDYEKRTKAEVTTHFSNSFLNLQQTAQNAADLAFGSFKQWLIVWAAALAVLLALLTIFVPLGAAYSDRYVFRAADLEKRISELEKSSKDRTTNSQQQEPQIQPSAVKAAPDRKKQ